MLTERQHRNFWRKVRVNPETGCHDWAAALGSGGYGSVCIGRKILAAHRLAYAMYHGPIPTGDGYHGTCVLHTCDNRKCVRREHLFLGTAADNIADMCRKGRGAQGRAHHDACPRGVAHHNARFDETAVAKVHEFRANGLSQRAIGQALGMSQQHVSKILAGQRRHPELNKREG